VTNDTTLGTVYILMAVMIVAGALIGSRGRLVRTLFASIALASLFAAGFIVFAFRDDLGYLGQRLRAEATGEPVRIGETLRIPMSIDGHFWVEAEIDGTPVKFLVDSGATMTTVDRLTARRAGLAVNSQRDQLVRTGNGMIRVSSAIAGEIAIGPIGRRRVRLHIADTDNINVLGMNFLSSLDRWGVEGRWLVLEG
jgi:aspartyl protease family protein